MKKTFGAMLLLSCAGLATAVAVAHPASTAGTLDATVGPGFSITLTQNGAKVTHLDPGDYTINVDDQSAEHNFHLSGPGVDQSTTVDGIGTATWNVTFQNGTYAYQCDAHVTTMHGSFTVGNVPATTTTGTPPPRLTAHASAKATGRIVSVHVTASRSASFAVSLMRGTARVAHTTAKGKAATVRLRAPKAGRYVAKVVAKAGGQTANTSAAVTVK